MPEYGAFIVNVLYSVKVEWTSYEQFGSIAGQQTLYKATIPWSDPLNPLKLFSKITSDTRFIFQLSVYTDIFFCSSSKLRTRIAACLWSCRKERACLGLRSLDVNLLHGSHKELVKSNERLCIIGKLQRNT